MTLSLSKGGNLSLSKVDPNVTQMIIGLGWDQRASTDAEFDLDASVFLLNKAGHVRGEHDLIFYNQLCSDNGAVVHLGDHPTDAGTGDDEVITVILPQVPADVDKIVVTVTIHDAAARQQSFAQVTNAYIRLVNAASAIELVRFDLADEYRVETAMVFGEVYRHQGEWKFRAVGQGYAGGLQALCHQYDIEIE